MSIGRPEPVKDSTPRLIADIGGTNARFALLLNGRVDDEIVLACAEHASLVAAVEHYLVKVGATTPQRRPREAAMAIAGPITGDHIRMTNHVWEFSAATTRRDLGLSRLIFMNDFTALAMSLRHLPPQDLEPIGGGRAVLGATIALLGPGTGLGVSGLVPSGEHWMGTDIQGRDVWARLVHGARISLSVGLVSQGIALGLGLMLGLFAGYYGKWIDEIVMRLADVTLAFPTLLLLIALVAALQPSLTVVFLTIGLVGWAAMARLVRGQVLVVRELEYVQAMRALGARNRRIIMRHVLPAVVAPVLIAATLGVAGAIMAEASLSFLGLGVQPPTPSWGAMIADGRDLSQLRGAPWILWITDLSKEDHWFILPILMGVAMFIQMKMSPASPDPAQAKMMMLTPVLVTILFLWYRSASGLTLYWLTGNVISIGQQWFIRNYWTDSA